MPERELPETQSFEVSKDFVFDTGEPILVLPGVKLEKRFESSLQEVQRALETKGIAIVTAPSGVGKTELLTGKGFPGNYHVPGGLEELFKKMGLSWFSTSLQTRAVNSDELATPEKVEKLNKTFDEQVIVTRDGAGGKLEKVTVIPNEVQVWVLDESLRVEGNEKLAKWLLSLRDSGKKLVLLGGGGDSSENQGKRIVQELILAGGGEELEESVVYLKPHLFTKDQAVELLCTASHMPVEYAGKIIGLLQGKGLPLLPRVVWMTGLPYNEARPISLEDKLSVLEDQMGYAGRGLWRNYCPHVIKKTNEQAT